jgi:hypothetical protein
MALLLARALSFVSLSPIEALHIIQLTSHKWLADLNRDPDPLVALIHALSDGHAVESVVEVALELVGALRGAAARKGEGRWVVLCGHGGQGEAEGEEGGEEFHSGDRDGGIDVDCVELKLRNITCGNGEEELI